ncbi:hypothetical protein MVES_001339 [Malassezia vespertilionis]|uniref:Uncharacterized protein n=1 Tax=Malassezia vespertilionis TaxID=2020962 RepID=A0A2N1JFD2_9BASI|nr:hypothetical protein MVES_001339 [Malassezia vespertilionis]
MTELAAALAHVRAAEAALAAVLAREAREAQNARSVAAERAANVSRNTDADLPADLPAAYRTLRRDYDALHARHMECMQKWREFKGWWRTEIRKRREQKCARVLSAAHATTDPPTSTEYTKMRTPLQDRTQVLEHRRHVRALLDEDPSMFKGTGRYASTKRAAAPVSAPPRTRRTMHAADCACCREYYAAVAPKDNPLDDAEHGAHARRQHSSRHRHAMPPETTPPDYCSSEAAEINRRARA